MLANPEVGVEYQEELAEGVAEDMAKVLRLHASVGSFDDCLVTKEWTPLAPGEIEQKYYCPDGGGLVAIGEHRGKVAVTRILAGDTLPEGTYAPAGVCP